MKPEIRAISLEFPKKRLRRSFLKYEKNVQLLLNPPTFIDSLLLHTHITSSFTLSTEF